MGVAAFFLAGWPMVWAGNAFHTAPAPMWYNDAKYHNLPKADVGCRQVAGWREVWVDVGKQQQREDEKTCDMD